MLSCELPVELPAERPWLLSSLLVAEEPLPAADDSALDAWVLSTDELSNESPDETLLDAPALEVSPLSSELLACEPLEDTAPDSLLRDCELSEEERCDELWLDESPLEELDDVSGG